MDGTEDFSFPRISDTHSFTIDSPPLWNPSLSCSSSTEDTRKAKGFEAKVMICDGQRESFLYENDEDRMDLLWENFNEDLSSTSAPVIPSSTEMVEVNCASTALTVVKSHGCVIASNNSCKPGGMLVLLKFVKKLFSVSTSHSKFPTSTTTATTSKVW